MSTNRSVRFGFSVSTVLVACRGRQVSFNTTVGGGGVCSIHQEKVKKLL